MMPTLRSFWLLVAVLAGVIGTVLCIRCYQCTTRKDPTCGDPFPSDRMTIECNKDAATNTIKEANSILKGDPGVIDFSSETVMRCLKIKHYGRRGNSTIVRGCYSFNRRELDICERIWHNLYEKNNFPDCDICSKDSCNGSSRLGSAWPASLLLPFVAAYLCLRQ